MNVPVSENPPPDPLDDPLEFETPIIDVRALFDHDAQIWLLIAVCSVFSLLRALEHADRP